MPPASALMLAVLFIGRGAPRLQTECVRQRAGREGRA